MAILVKDMSQVLTMEDGLGVRENVSILVEAEKITKIGRIKSVSGAEVIDAQGCVVMPGLVDPHTHLVFAGSREDEMAMRLAGESYESINQRGGGIMRTVESTRRASEEVLFELGQSRIASMITTGTTAVEIKSGYGLRLKDELKMLRVIRRLKETTMVDIIATFLGAHAIPKGMSRRAYIDKLVNEMLPAIAAEDLADFCDVFMEEIAFTRKETQRIFERARDLGMKLKIHADELTNCGGAIIAGEYKATSADHLIHTDKKGIAAMKKGRVVPVLLPGTALFLKMRRHPMAGEMFRAGLPVALGSDFNPGTCMIPSMFLIIGLACFIYDFSVAQALAAATINGAKAIGLEHRIGSIKEGKQADLLILKIRDFEMVPYLFGQNFLGTVIKKGVVIYEQNSGMRSQF